MFQTKKISILKNGSKTERLLVDKYEQECFPLYEHLKSLVIKVDFKVLQEMLYIFNFFEEYEKCSMVKKLMNKFYPEHNHSLINQIETQLRNPKEILPVDFHIKINQTLTLPYQEEIYQLFTRAVYPKVLWETFKNMLIGNYSPIGEEFGQKLMENFWDRWSLKDSNPEVLAMLKENDRLCTEQTHELYELYQELKKIKDFTLEDIFIKKIEKYVAEQDELKQKSIAKQTKIDEKRKKGEERYQKKKKIRNIFRRKKK
jgi:hypothetical protein